MKAKRGLVVVSTLVEVKDTRLALVGARNGLAVVETLFGENDEFAMVGDIIWKESLVRRRFSKTPTPLSINVTSAAMKMTPPIAQRNQNVF